MKEHFSKYKYRFFAAGWFGMFLAVVWVLTYALKEFLPPHSWAEFPTFVTGLCLALFCLVMFGINAEKMDV